MSAGDDLRAAVDSTLRKGFRWDARERLILDRACAAADRAEGLQASWDDADASLKVRLSAELRALEKQIAELIFRLNPQATGAPKSDRHQRAANTRWGNHG